MQIVKQVTTYSYRRTTHGEYASHKSKEQREQFYHVEKRDHQKGEVNANNAKSPE